MNTDNSIFTKVKDNLIKILLSTEIREVDPILFNVIMNKIIEEMKDAGGGSIIMKLIR
jgi:hypothetical protein